MSVRSTSFVGSYDPAGLPGPGQANNNPPPLPPSRKLSEPIYQDIDDYQASKGGEAAYQAYLNPAFREERGDESTRYVKRIAPETAPKPGAKKKKQAPPTPNKPTPAKAPASPDDSYMTPDVPQEDSYMALRVQVS